MMVGLSKFHWCMLSQPGHGHFIKASCNVALQSEPSIVCNADQELCPSAMQTRYSVPFVFDNLIKMATFCSKNKITSMQGYYAHCDKPATDKQGI
jgi:hypothetical protein